MLCRRSCGKGCWRWLDAEVAGCEAGCGCQQNAAVGGFHSGPGALAPGWVTSRRATPAYAATGRGDQTTKLAGAAGTPFAGRPGARGSSGPDQRRRGEKMPLTLVLTFAFLALIAPGRRGPITVPALIAVRRGRPPRPVRLQRDCLYQRKPWNARLRRGPSNLADTAIEARVRNRTHAVDLHKRAAAAGRNVVGEQTRRRIGRWKLLLTCENARHDRDVLMCECCGQWTVEQIVIDRGRGPRPLLRVRHHQYVVGEFTSTEQVVSFLRTAGVLANLQPAG